MPDRLTLQATVVLVAVALGLAFGVGMMVGGGASTARPTAQRAPALVQTTPGSALDVELTAARAVPALQASRVSRSVRPLTTTLMARRSANPAPTLVVSAPVATAEAVRPTPTAVPRDVAPPPPRVVPTPKPKPEPTATPESSGAFDTAGNFDTTGEPSRGAARK